MEIEKEGPTSISGGLMATITRRKAGENAAAKAEECQAKVFFLFSIISFVTFQSLVHIHN